MATILITGASRGIGLALAQRYAARGDQVIATMRRADKSAPAHALDGDVEFLAVDVADVVSLAAAAKRLKDRPIDILICNAGINEGRAGLDDPAHTADMWARLFATNVAGAFFTARAFAPNVIAARGKIAVISSRMGSSTAAGGNAYAYRASKAAAANIAANLAMELQPKGVAVAAYHPGWVSTDMGGASAPVNPDTSAQGLVSRIDALSLVTTGAFENFDGTPIQF